MTDTTKPSDHLPPITPEWVDRINGEFEDIAFSLERLNGVFAQFWKMGKPTVAYTVPTAAVGFNEAGACIEFTINPIFWDSLNYESKLFLISHECLHVILDHGARAKDSLRGEDRDAVTNPMTQMEDSLCNIAMDVTINESLVEYFGFTREVLNLAEANSAIRDALEDAASKAGFDISDPKYKNKLACPELEATVDGSFLDTVFSKIKPDVAPHKSYEYYYDTLYEYFEEKINEEKDENARQELINQMLKEMAQNAMDSHRGLDSLSSGGEGDPADSDADGKGDKSPGERIVEDVIENAERSDIEDLDEKLSKSFGGKGHPGDPLIEGAIDQINEFRPQDIRKIRKWQDLFRRYVKKAQDDSEEMQWVKEARRYAMLPKDFLLPCVNDQEDMSEKFFVWLFIDCSGSCYHLKDQFFKAAYSIDPRYFDIKIFARTTKVHKLEYGSKNVSGYGGSDDYSCIERHIQSELKARRITKYPEIVMHFTDGGDCNPVMVKPERPLNWWWFMADKSDRLDRIPNECHKNNRIFYLDDFEN